MKTLVIGEICVHEELNNSKDGLKYLGGIFLVHEWFRKIESVQVLAITGENLINELLNENFLDIVYASPKASKVVFLDDGLESDMKIFPQNFDYNLVISKLKKYSLDDEYAVYCPAFPGYEKIIEYLITTGCTLAIDFGFFPWRGKINSLIREIGRYNYHSKCILQINISAFSDNEITALNHVLFQNNAEYALMTNGESEVKIIWDKHKYNYIPRIEKSKKTCGAGDVFITNFLIERNLGLEKRLKSSNEVVIRYLRDLNGISNKAISNMFQVQKFNKQIS